MTNRTLLLVPLALLPLALGCAHPVPAPVPTAVAVAPRPPTLLEAYVLEDVDILVRYDMQRVRQWAHAELLAERYANMLGSIAGQVDVYRRATEAVTAIWRGQRHGFVSIIRGDIHDDDVRQFPGGDSDPEQLGRFTMYADHFGAVARVADDVLVYGNPAQVIPLLRNADAGEFSRHRRSLTDLAERAEFGQHAVSFATDGRFDPYLIEAFGYVDVGEELEGRARLTYIHAEGAERTMRGVEGVRRNPAVRMLLGSLLNALQLERTDAVVQARLHVSGSQGHQLARFIPTLIRTLDRGARSTR